MIKSVLFKQLSVLRTNYIEELSQQRCEFDEKNVCMWDGGALFPSKCQVPADLSILMY